MIPYERQATILKALSKDDLLKIEELQLLIPGVSISTLRRDLKELEKLGKVVMLTGGAVKRSSPTIEMPISTKRSLHSEEKEVIADLAVTLINDGDVIYLDSGSSCTALLNKILQKKILIVTTNANVLGVSNDVRAEIIVLGGRYNPNTSSINGPLADNNIEQFNFDKSFLGANGIDVSKGGSTPDLVEANKKRQVINNSKKTYLLCDSSKFHQNSTVKAFDLAEVTLITDQFDQQIGKVTDIISPT